MSFFLFQNVKGRNESDSEEVTDIIQEIIKNLRLMQLRSIKRKKYFKQVKRTLCLIMHRSEFPFVKTCRGDTLLHLA